MLMATFCVLRRVREMYTFSLAKFIFRAQSDRDPRKVSGITVAEKKQLYAMSYGVKSV